MSWELRVVSTNQKLEMSMAVSLRGGGKSGIRQRTGHQKATVSASYSFVGSR